MVISNITIIKCLQTVVLEQTQQWHHEDVCDPENLIKRVGIGASCVLLLLFAVVTYAGKGVWDMFHAIRYNALSDWMESSKFDWIPI